MKTQENIEQLTAFAELLKQNGFTVLVSASHPFKWLHFEKNGQFGYVQPNHFGGFDFRSTHKPDRKWGTGLSISQQVELTINEADKAMVRMGNWYGQPVSVKRYKDAGEFLNSPHTRWAEYYVA